MRGIPPSVYSFRQYPLTCFGTQRVAMQNASSVSYLHTDHLGSTSVTTDANGNQTGTQTYFPFGSIRSFVGNSLTDYGFTGQRLDSSNGLMYYGARYYDTHLNRFISADTTVPGAGNPQALNRYAYVNNNPLAHVDPSGHCWGAASGIRGLWSYAVTCGNLDMALTIVKSERVRRRKGTGGWLYGRGRTIACGVGSRS